MGIRFVCPNGHKLNVKTFLAGKRGICPQCDAKFIIPANSGGQCIVVEDEAGPPATDSPPPAKPAPVVAPPVVTNVPPAPVAPTAPADVWYVKPAKGDDQYGPASSEDMRTWIAEDRIAPDSWIWKTGWPEWKFGSEALDELKSPTAELPHPPVSNPVSNDVVTRVQLETHTPVASASKKLRKKSPRSRQLRAQKITVTLGVLVLLLGVVMVVVLSLQ